MILLESFRAQYAHVLAKRGETARVNELGKSAVRLAFEAVRQGNEMPNVRLEIAAIHAIQGQKEAALEWLQHAYEADYKGYRTLSLDPMFENLREERRFKELVSRMKSDVAVMRERSADLRESCPIPCTRINRRHWRLERIQCRKIRRGRVSASQIFPVASIKRGLL